MLAGAGPDIDDPVGMPDHVELVLDHKQRIAGCFQAVERPQQRFGIGWVKTRRGLIEHVNHAKQIGAHLRGQPQSLQLAGRQRRRAAFER